MPVIADTITHPPAARSVITPCRSLADSCTQKSPTLSTSIKCQRSEVLSITTKRARTRTSFASPRVRFTPLSMLLCWRSSKTSKPRNRQLYQARAYDGQPADLSRSANRWLIESHDTRSLYRQHNRTLGIPVRVAAHINIDDWLREGSGR